MFSVLDASFFTCKYSFYWAKNTRLFGTPFFEGSNASEILRLNRKFTVEFEGLQTLKQEMKNPNTKINKDGKQDKLLFKVRS